MLIAALLHWRVEDRPKLCLQIFSFSAGQVLYEDKQAPQRSKAKVLKLTDNCAPGFITVRDQDVQPSGGAGKEREMYSDSQALSAPSRAHVKDEAAPGTQGTTTRHTEVIIPASLEAAKNAPPNALPLNGKT